MIHQAVCQSALPTSQARPHTLKVGPGISCRVKPYYMHIANAAVFGSSASTIRMLSSCQAGYKTSNAKQIFLAANDAHMGIGPVQSDEFDVPEDTVDPSRLEAPSEGHHS